MKKIFLLSAFIALVTLGKAQNNCAGEKTFYDLESALLEPEKVVKLDIAMQKLTEISAEIGKLTNLRCLDLAFNRFGTLPSEFKNLEKLEYLNLSGTRHMPKLPEVLIELPNLKVVNIADHPEWSAETWENAKKLLPNVQLITE